VCGRPLQLYTTTLRNLNLTATLELKGLDIQGARGDGLRDLARQKPQNLSSIRFGGASCKSPVNAASSQSYSAVVLSVMYVIAPDGSWVLAELSQSVCNPHANPTPITLSVQRRQIFISSKKILYTFLHITSFFLLSGWRDVRTHISWLKDKIKFDSYYKLHNKNKKR